MSQVTGIVKIYLDGGIIRSKPGAKLMMGGVTRDPVTGHTVYGFNETAKESTLDCTIAHMGDTDARALSDMTDVTLKFETDTGQTYSVAHAWTSEPCELSEGGDLSLKMAGPQAVLES